MSLLKMHIDNYIHTVRLKIYMIFFISFEKKNALSEIKTTLKNQNRIKHLYSIRLQSFQIRLYHRTVSQLYFQRWLVNAARERARFPQ